MKSPRRISRDNYASGGGSVGMNNLTAEVATDALTLAIYSTDASIYQVTPAGVICPQNVSQVQAAVRAAAEQGTPIVARGAGSGLAGESLTTGLVLDFSRHFSAIESIDVPGRAVVVQVGCVLGRLNARLAAHRLLFGPDPSSGNRATLGGVLANNATGAHSIRYGYASDHARWIDAVLADGTRARFHADGRIEGEKPSDLRTRIASTIPPLLAQWRGRIEEHWPKIARNRAGYNARGALRDDGTIDWPKLLCGSEGTLAIFTSAALTLDEVPAAKGLLQVNFDSLLSMAMALPALVATGCSACELMDAACLSMAREANGGPHKHLPEVAASLAIEHNGASLEEVRAKLTRTRDVATKCPGILGNPQEILDRAEQAELWSVRKKAVPLLFRQRKAAQPVPFIEDVAVDIRHMADYLAQLQPMLAAEGTPVAYYAHAGSGELHIRPFLDLHDPLDREKMLRIARRTFELAWRCGGTISGEHGCGWTRSGFLRRQYGPLYELFEIIKHTFDPQGILNPGKIITDGRVERLMTENLRFDHRIRADKTQQVELSWGRGELAAELEACNGCGECRSIEDKVTMCPVYRALGAEWASPRAKVNLLRHILTGTLDESLRLAPAFAEMAEHCLQCKSCVRECPSAVNVPKLMLEARSYYTRHRGLTAAQATLSRGETMGLLGSRFGALANAVAALPPVRAILQRVIGITRGRRLPGFAFGSFCAKHRNLRLPWMGDGTHEGASPEAAKVAYFVDIFANFHDHSLAQAAVDVLRHNEVEVVLPRQKSSAMPAIDYGRLDAARRSIAFNLEHLSAAIEQGYEVVCSEPSAALCLKKEWPDVLRDGQAERARTVAQHAHELMEYLLSLHLRGRLRRDFRPVPLHLAYHAPCHLKSLRSSSAGVELLSLIPGVKIDRIDKGCCGIAGTFGFQQRYYDLSMQIGAEPLAAIRQSLAPYALTECSTCKLQIEHGAGKFAFHPIKVLALAYGYEVKGTPRI